MDRLGVNTLNLLNLLAVAVTLVFWGTVLYAVAWGLRSLMRRAVRDGMRDALREHGDGAARPS